MSFLRNIFKSQGNAVDAAKSAADRASRHMEATLTDLPVAVSAAERVAAAAKRLMPRTVLFVPGNNLRAMKKAELLNVDAVILDLEDAVSPDQKFQARDNIANSLKSGALKNKKVVVRVNSPRLAPQWGMADLDACGVLREQLYAVAIPKVEPGDDQLLREHMHPDLARWGFIESPKGVLGANEICASGAFTTMVIGSNDLSAELKLPLQFPRTATTAGASATEGAAGTTTSSSVPPPPAVSRRFGLFGSMAHVVLAARAHGLGVLDGVFNDLSDSNGFLSECMEGKLMGFDGKTIIHPSQVAPCRSVFCKVPEPELNWARRVLEEADNNPEAIGAISVEGTLVEELHIRRAAEIVALHEFGSELEEQMEKARETESDQDRMYRRTGLPKRQAPRNFNLWGKPQDEQKWERTDKEYKAASTRMPSGQN